MLKSAGLEKIKLLINKKWKEAGIPYKGVIKVRENLFGSVHWREQGFARKVSEAHPQILTTPVRFLTHH